MAEHPTNAIEVRNLVKRFGDRFALNGLDLDIRKGELLSLLGPNGAGKSTTLRILTTLLPATEGTVMIAGFSVGRENHRIRPLLGLVPQEIALYDLLTARQNLHFFGRLYGLHGRTLHQRTRDLLEAVDLTTRADDLLFTFSGGMQRRVNIAAALLHDPEIIFLDEPTVGLDPNSRTAIWRIIDDLKKRGKTLVLTTHYLEEAEQLSNRVAIIDHGRLIALGTTPDLIRAADVQTAIRLAVSGDPAACVVPLRELPEVTDVRVLDERVEVQARCGSHLLPQLIQRLLSLGVEVRSAEVSAPDLGGVFLHHTGRQLRAEEDGGTEAAGQHGRWQP
jgi:ABC-2 type transport system ATP-binding protein